MISSLIETRRASGCDVWGWLWTSDQERHITTGNSQYNVAWHELADDVTECQGGLGWGDFVPEIVYAPDDADQLVLLPGVTSNGGLSIRVPRFRPFLMRGGTAASERRHALAFDYGLIDALGGAIAVAPEKLDPEAAAIIWLRQYLSVERIGQLVGVSRQRVHEWLNGSAMSSLNRKRLLAVREIIGRALERHKSALDLQRWLDTPWPPDGRTPAEELAAGELGRVRFMSLSSPESLKALEPRAASQGRPIRDPFSAEPRTVVMEEDED